MRIFLISLLVLLSSQAQALVLLKCTAGEGKTLWASFGRYLRSQDTAYTYFPVELVVFSSRTTLQDRLLFDTLADSLKVEVRMSKKFIGFDFEAKGDDGVLQTEGIKIMRYKDDDPNTFFGTWVTTRDGQQRFEQAACTVY